VRRLALLLAALGAFGRLAAADFRYTAGDVFQAMLEAEDHRAWLQAEVDKSEQPADLKKEPKHTLGHLVAKNGGKARLVIDAPAAGLIVADGKHLWVELPQVEQVMCYDQARLAASGNFFLDLASSIRHYAKASIKRRFEDASRVSALEMVPEQPRKAGFERLRIWVDDHRWVVLRVQMEYGGTRTDIRFKDIQVMSLRGLRADPGQALAGELFQYKAPKGYEVFNLDL
jgi:outer membrane lipoprotein-sorting protein